ncbi:MAG: histidinol-phosphatase HisJ family protein [Candidatus Pelethousia sp.]|nr:histidinol-phosphatase HisJ family protein [Candidatus Pelethousia sp.]
MFLTDYHVHSDYSADSTASLRAQLEAARAAGVVQLCFTDHVDFDDSGMPPADLAARDAAIEALRADFPDITIRRGAEVSLKNEAVAAAALAHCKGRDLDFVIASLHIVDGVDAYYPEFFQGATQEAVYARYLDFAAQALPANPVFSVLGHYDFCAKFAPYAERAVRYAHAASAFDSLFRYMAQSGKGMEINTSAWRDGPAWGLDVLCRYRELGGEFITTGSDAHLPDRVGKRLGEALELARAAGIPYVATFERMEPTFHKL